MFARIAGQQMRKRIVLLAEVLEFLRQCVSQVQFGVRVEGPVRQQPLEPLDVVVLRRLPSCRRQSRVRAPETRLAAQARLVRRLGLGEASQELECSRVIEVQAGALRVQRHGTSEAIDRLLDATRRG